VGGKADDEAETERVDEEVEGGLGRREGTAPGVPGRP
jgi:hypothetical protein